MRHKPAAANRRRSKSKSLSLHVRALLQSVMVELKHN